MLPFLGKAVLCLVIVAYITVGAVKTLPRWNLYIASAAVLLFLMFN